MPLNSHRGVRKPRPTSRERENRISQRIQKVGRKGISAKQIASRERISRSRAYHYLRQIRGKQKHRAKIERLDKKYYYIETAQRKRRETTRRPRPQEPREETRELRGYINYASSYFRSRDIDIDCVILIQKEPAATAAGIRRIKDKVERRFGYKLTSMLKFGYSLATPQSSNHFLYRRHGGNWIAF
jgi:hypothetical protein